ncbi:MAG: hypothetical protein J6B54_02475, partial [Clostridia bacterium]|nr:hypothetical protein [Clostridia bacterium]
MIKLIVGLKGTGKTKTLITETNAAMAADRGCVVCVEKGRKLIYDISHKVRLISSDEYDINTYDRFFGFLCGLMSANYDITDIFVDSITKICGDDLNALEAFLAEVSQVIRNINITITLSKDPGELTDELKKYL